MPPHALKFFFRDPLANTALFVGEFFNVEFRETDHNTANDRLNGRKALSSVVPKLRQEASIYPFIACSTQDVAFNVHWANLQCMLG